MKRRTWSTFLNSEQYVQLQRWYGVITLPGVQKSLLHQFNVVFTVLKSVCVINYPQTAVWCPYLWRGRNVNPPVKPAVWVNVVWFLQVCLGEGAKEESNVVEVTAMNHQGKTVSVPIANLHISCLPMVPCTVANKLYRWAAVPHSRRLEFDVSLLWLFSPQVSLGEFELKAPVTIRLKAGSGPVTVSGLHLIGNTSLFLILPLLW